MEHFDHELVRYLVLEIGLVARRRGRSCTQQAVRCLGVKVQQRDHHVQDEVLLELLVDLQLLFVELFLRQECALVLRYLVDEFLFNF